MNDSVQTEALDKRENPNAITEAKPIRDVNKTQQFETKADEDNSKLVVSSEKSQEATDEKEIKELVGLPVDRGWAWVLLAGKIYLFKICSFGSDCPSFWSLHTCYFSKIQPLLSPLSYLTNAKLQYCL